MGVVGDACMSFSPPGPGWRHRDISKTPSLVPYGRCVMSAFSSFRPPRGSLMERVTRGVPSGSNAYTRSCVGRAPVFFISVESRSGLPWIVTNPSSEEM